MSGSGDIGKPFSFSFRILVMDDSGRCLLIRRSHRSREMPGKWDFPGGKFAPDENFNDALHREVEEETNLKITIKGALGLAEFEIEPVNVICVILEAKKSPGDVKLSDEHIEHTWIYPDAIMNMDLAEWFHPFMKSYLHNKHKYVE